MPSVASETPGVNAVANFKTLFSQLLEEAAISNPTSAVEPPLLRTHLKNLSERSTAALSILWSADLREGGDQSEGTKLRQNAVIETAARDLFGQIVVRQLHHQSRSP